MLYWFSFRSTALQGMQPGWVKSSVTGWWGFTGAAFWVQERPATIREVTGLSGVGSGGECSGLPVDTMLNQWQVVGLHFDADRVEALDECGLDGGARSRERVKHDTTGW